MTEDPDAPPRTNMVEEGSDGDKGDETVTEQPFNWYLKHDRFFTIVTNRWGIFTIISGIIYLYEIIWTISGVNNYCDISRTFNQDTSKKLSCLTSLGKTLTAEADIAKVSGVYDFPILIVTIYHMIEWIRWTILGTAALVDANLIAVFQVLHLNIIFGFFAILIAIIGGVTAPANCSAVQPERARYLTLQIVCLVTWIPCSFAPYFFMKMKGTRWVHEQYIMDPDADDDDEEDEKVALAREEQ